MGWDTVAPGIGMAKVLAVAAVHHAHTAHARHIKIAEFKLARFNIVIPWLKSELAIGRPSVIEGHHRIFTVWSAESETESMVSGCVIIAKHPALKEPFAFAGIHFVPLAKTVNIFQRL